MPSPAAPRPPPAATADEDPGAPLNMPTDAAGDSKQRFKPKRTDVIVAITLPWLVFFLVSCLFLFAFRDLELLVWILIAGCVCLALLFLGLGIVARHTVFMAIGLLCLVSSAAATSLGLWLDDAYLQRYSIIIDSATYKDVDPKADAGNTPNPGIIHFRPGTIVDDRRTIGWVDGSIFCIAPVVSPLAYHANIEYWATGLDCCEQRSAFDCGDAREPGVVTAIIAEEDPRYREAVNMAESIYRVNSSSKAHLLEFARDGRQVANDLWDEALSIVLVAAVVDLLVCVLAGVVLLQVIRKAKPPAAM